MDNPATKLKCFPWSPNHTTKKTRNSSPCWFFTILRPVNRKIHVISVQEDQANFQVSNEVQTGQTVSKEEYDRVLQERNSLNDQLRRNEKEINRLKTLVRRLVSDLSGLLSDMNNDRQTIVSNNLSHTQAKTGSSSNNTEQQSLATADSNVVNKDQNEEKAREDDNNRPVLRVERDIIGARASPVPLLDPPVHSGVTPPKPPRPTEESLMSYTELFRIFDSIRKERQLKAAGLKPARPSNNSPNNTEQQSLATADSNIVNKDQNKEKAREDDKNRPVLLGERDIIGATPTPLQSLPPRVHSAGTPPKPPRPTEESTMSYTEIFDSIRKERQLEAASAPNNLS